MQHDMSIMISIIDEMVNHLMIENIGENASHEQNCRPSMFSYIVRIRNNPSLCSNIGSWASWRIFE